MTVLRLPDARATEALGARLARALEADTGLVLYLMGDLGAGKTTLARGLLAALGHPGRVRSPTYTLVEPYEVGGRRVHHLDLYRIAHPRDAEALGVRELGGRGELVVVEWPERGAGFIPAADLVVDLGYDAEARTARFEPRSPRGQAIMDRCVNQ